MLKAVVLVGAFLSICSVTCTKEQRRAARQRFRPYAGIAWLIAAAGWVFILWPWGRH
jgi:hypothetical protein